LCIAASAFPPIAKRLLSRKAEGSIPDVIHFHRCLLTDLMRLDISMHTPIFEISGAHIGIARPFGGACSVRAGFRKAALTEGNVWRQRIGDDMRPANQEGARARGDIK
jgi:hypothetical protein